MASFQVASAEVVQHDTGEGQDEVHSGILVDEEPSEEEDLPCEAGHLGEAMDEEAREEVHLQVVVGLVPWGDHTERQEGEEGQHLVDTPHAAAADAAVVEEASERVQDRKEHAAELAENTAGGGEDRRAVAADGASASAGAAAAGDSEAGHASLGPSALSGPHTAEA